MGEEGGGACNGGLHRDEQVRCAWQPPYQVSTGARTAWICARTSGNRVVQAGILRAKEKISEGHDMAGPLAESKVFPTMVVQMIGVGEQTGAMDQMLQKIADFYEEEVDTAVAGLTSLIEPVMMAFLGVLTVGFIYEWKKGALEWE